MTSMTGMTKIAICERGAGAPGPVVSIDGQEYPFTLADPLRPRMSGGSSGISRSIWTFPSSTRSRRAKQPRASRPTARRSSTRLFADRRAYARYAGGLAARCGNACFEVAGLTRLPPSALGGAQRPRAAAALCAASSLCAPQLPAAADAGRAAPLTHHQPAGRLRPAARGSGRRAIAPSRGRWSMRCARPTCAYRWTSCGRAPMRRSSSTWKRCRTATARATTTSSTSTCMAPAVLCRLPGREAAGGSGLGAPTFEARYGRSDLPPYAGSRPSSFWRAARKGRPTRSRPASWRGCCSSTRCRSPFSTPARAACRWATGDESGQPADGGRDPDRAGHGLLGDRHGGRAADAAALRAALCRRRTGRRHLRRPPGALQPQGAPGLLQPGRGPGGLAAAGRLREPAAAAQDQGLHAGRGESVLRAAGGALPRAQGGV